MSAVGAVLMRFREQPTSLHGSVGNPLNLVSTLDCPAVATEIFGAWPERRPPEELCEAWAITRESRLFEDVEYGQWGLILLSPRASADRTMLEMRARPADFTPDDIVVGEFLGDQELLVLVSDADGDRVLVALSLDDRSDWYVAAESLGEFLEAYWRHGGEKFWERSDGA